MPVETAGNASVSLRFVSVKGHMAWNEAAGPKKKDKPFLSKRKEGKAGVLIPLSESADIFQNTILTALRSAHLYEESKQFFRYKSAVLIKNPALEEKYNAFRAKKKNTGYTEDELKESYGFLLFDDASKANALGETGVLAGNSKCTILGDPSKGIYISMYSDCLDQNRWYHGKSGYIAIIRLTKGKVKKVLENYTDKFTEPTVGFDCHVSDQLASVSAKTSSFLAFERTQYYIYELLDDGSYRTGLSPAASCPFAVVSFSYMDTKATIFVPQEKSELKKQVFHYVPWRGKLHIGSKFYSVDLRLAARAFLPTTLPPVVKVDVASMSDVQRLLPRAVFEISFTDEVFFDNLYCTLCELVPSESEDTSSFDQLLLEIKERDLAFTVSLKENGFLILLHLSHFLRYDDTEFPTMGLLQGVFVFPESSAIRPDTKPVKKELAVSSEILQILPVLSYAESELEKTLMDQDQKLCEVLLEHMQSYATLINPGLATSPSRDVSMFPDQYDVAEAHSHIYSKPEWTCNAWQSLSSYMSKPETFQLPLATVLEILAARQEDQREDLDDDVYICVSSPEETQAHHLDLDAEDKLPHRQSPVSIKKSLDIGVPNSETHLDITTVPETISQADVTKDSKSYNDLTELNQADSGGSLCPALEDLPAELIVSITSAKQNVIDQVPSANPSNFQFSGLSTEDSFTSVDEKSLSKEREKMKKVLDSSEVSQRVSANLMGIKPKQHRGFIKALQNVTKSCDDPYSLPVGVTPMQVDSKNYRTDEYTKEMDHPLLRDSPKTKLRRFYKRKRIFGKLKKKKATPTTNRKMDSGKLNSEGTILPESEAFFLKRKTERWDLKPIISICGRILVPHGSGQVDDLLRSFNVKPQLTEGKNCPENLLNGEVLKSLKTIEIEQDSDIAPVIAPAVEETKTTKSIPGENDNLLADSSLVQSHGEDFVAWTSVTNATSLENNYTNTPLQQTTQEKKTEAFSLTKLPTEGEVLGRLRTVISKKKTKIGQLETSEMIESTIQDTEPCVKKVKVQSEETKCENALTQETKSGVAGNEKMSSVDPSFAFALGLTQKSSPNEGLSTQDQEPQQRKSLNDDQEQTSTKVTQTFPITLTKRHRIKRLNKHEGITAEHVKKKWWLHFQTPAFKASDKVQNNDCTRDMSVRKTAVKNMCSSTDALNLLADLALSVSNDQVPLQPNPSVEREPERCDLAKGLTSSEQESVLHALLKNPAISPKQPLEPSPPAPPVGDRNFDSVFAEHAYSQPPSSSPLFGLSGTPLGVSTRVLQDQTKWADEDRTLPASVVQEHKASEYLHKHKQKFKNFRSVFFKEESIKVTRHWQEHYDFNLDSKFTSDPKIRVVTRALHGPWNSPFQDISEELRLIFHMWIGLFYSRTTARFFNVDSHFMFSCLESYSLKAANEISAPAKPESLSASFVNLHTSHSTEPKALNLSKDETAILKPEADILDLSVRTSNSQVHRKVDSNENTGLSNKFKRSKSSVKFQESNISKVEKASKHFTETTREVEKTDTPKDACLDCSDATFFERNGTDVFLNDYSGKTMQAFSENGEVMDGNYDDTCVISFGSTQASDDFLKHVKLDLSNSVTNKNGDIVETQDVLCLDDHDPHKLVIEKSCQMTTNVKPSLKVSTENCTALDEEEEDIVLKANYLENDKWFSRKNREAALSKQRNDLNGHVDMEGEFQVQDHLKENKLHEKISCMSPMEADHDLRDPKVLQMGNPNQVNESQMNEQLPLTVSPKEDCENLYKNQITLNDNSLVSNSPTSILSEVKKAFLADACLALGTNSMKEPLLVSEERTYSFDESNADLSGHQSKDSIEAGVQDKVSDLSFDLGSNYQDQEPGSTDRIADNATPTETFQLQRHFPTSDDKDSCEMDMLKETDFKEDKTTEVVDSKYSENDLPFCRMDIPEMDTQPQVKVQEAFPCQETMSHFTGNIKSTCVLPSDVCVTSQSCSLEVEASTQDTLMCDVNEPQKQILLESAFSSRSSTPTVDEKPYEGIPNLTSSCNSSVFHGRKSYQNTTYKFPSQTLAGLDEQPSEQKSKTASGNTDSVHKKDFLSDINLRTMRIIQSIDQFLVESNPVKMPSYVETEGTKISFDEKHNSIENFVFTCSTPSQPSGEKKNQMGQQVVVGSSVTKSQDLNKKLSDNNLSSTAKNKTSGALKSKDYKRQTSSVLESKFEDVDKYETSLDPDCHFHKSLMSIESLEDGFDSDKHETSHFDPSYIQYQEKEYFKNSLIPSPMQCLESSDASTNFNVESPGFLVKSLKETDDQTTESINEKDITDKTQMCYKDDASGDSRRDPSSSLVCTVFNTDGKKTSSFLERLSQRCLSEDLTQTSMEQECLIFLEEMKNLLKKSKRRQICHQETHDSLRMPCTSPVTIKFSSLEEQDDSFDLLDTSLFGQKIKVDVSKRKDLSVITEEKVKTPDAHNLSQGTRSPISCTLVSNVTSECAKLYKARMHELCSAKKILSKSKTSRVQQSHSDTKHNEHFDFCDKMKKELSKTFQSKLNAVVKKSCKTKNRFFLLVTSDDQFFEETKAQLELEGHIAVQPSKFFVCEEKSTSLFIILKNEDIAEHICKVPHLLKLKMSPDVQFTGIDEPDDVVNLTYQELFTRGGFILLNKSVLEPLSLCNMKKISQILQELSRTGKWKWMLHYKDSRRLKENARLSKEANDMKKHLNWGLDAGILEVLPYHECDLMSKDQPEYLKCLLNLQVQNITYRYSVFITDAEDGAFEKNGILTMTLNTFLTTFLSDSF